jgi:hypothetical protein
VCYFFAAKQQKNNTQTSFLGDAVPQTPALGSGKPFNLMRMGSAEGYHSLVLRHNKTHIRQEVKEGILLSTQEKNISTIDSVHRVSLVLF